MPSGRRDSVHRHIGNLHSGAGSPIPFVEYLAGRRNEFYPPGPRPIFGTKRKSISNKMQEELEKVYIKRVADKCLPPPGDPIYSDSIDMARAQFLKRCVDDEKC